ncbi:MAG: uracil-DNA glycosylase family protein, partial [Verrucomicrobiota bacterium]
AGPIRGGGRPRRLHDRASRAEMMACRPWLLAEIQKVQPAVIVTLGNTAARSLVSPDFRVLDDRGRITRNKLVDFEGELIATVHPSYLLRLPRGLERDREWERWKADLRLARSLLHRKDSSRDHEGSA